MLGLWFNQTVWEQIGPRLVELDVQFLSLELAKSHTQLFELCSALACIRAGFS